MSGETRGPKREGSLVADTGRSVFRERFLGNLGSNLVLLFAGLAANIVLLRLFVDELGPSECGVWLFLASLGEFLLLFDLGMGSALVRFIAGARGSGDHLREWCVGRAGRRFFLFAAGGAAAATLLLAGPVRSVLGSHVSVSPGVVLTLVLVGFEAAVTLLFTPARARLQAVHRYDLVNWVFLGRLVVRFAALVILLPAFPQTVTVAACGLAATLAANLAVVRLARGRSVGGQEAGRCSEGLWGTLAGYAAWVFLSMVGVRLAYTADTLVVGRFLPPETITLYYSAWRIVELVRAIGHGASPFFLPFGSERTGALDREALPVAFYQGARIVTVLTFPLGVVLLSAGTDVLRLWLGTGFEGAGTFLLLLLVPQLLILTFSPGSALVFGMGRQKVLVLYSLFSGVVNVGVSILLVRSIGAVGVAAGTLIALSVSLVFNVWFFAREIGFSRWIFLRIVGRGVLLLAGGVAVSTALADRLESPVARLFLAGLLGMLFVPAYLGWEFSARERRELMAKVFTRQARMTDGRRGDDGG